MADKMITQPRVLVLAQNKMQPFTGGGVVLSNLFSEFESQKVIFIHRDKDYKYESGMREFKVNASWLKLNPIELIKIFFKYTLLALINPLKIRLNDILKLLLQSSHFCLPKLEDEQIKVFSPQVLYAWVSDCFWARSVIEVASRYNIPYVIHYMDNHIEMNSNSLVDLSLKDDFTMLLNKVNEKADRLYVISESMGAAYSKRWGKQCEVFHGLLDHEMWPWPNSKTEIDDGVFRIAFTGSAENGQLKGLKTIAESIARITNKAQCDIRLILYLTQNYALRVKSYLADFSFIEIRPHPNFSNLRSELASVDALLLAYGTDEQTINYYRYSFATKIVPYMMSDRAIFVYGPEEIEPIAYAKRDSWATVCISELPNDIDDSLLTFVKNLEQRKKMAEHAWCVGRNEHDLKINSNRFSDSLISTTIYSIGISAAPFTMVSLGSV